MSYQATMAAVEDRGSLVDGLLAGGETTGDFAGSGPRIEAGADLLRHVLDTCPVPVTLNRARDGKIIYESPATEKLLGYGRSQVGRSVRDRWADLRDRDGYLKRLRAEGVIQGMEIRFRKADGTAFPCAIFSRLMDYRGEEVIVSTLFDLTELSAAKAEVAQQRELLEQSARLSAMGELLAGISHELNNPLSVLVVQAAALEESARDEKTAKRASRISRAADRCARIVKSFLAMARQEPAEMLPLDLNAVIEDALEVTAYALRTSGIEVSLQLADNLPAVSGDGGQLRQVMTNLLVNAQHALQEVDGPRRIRISSRYRRQDNKVIVKVKDNGPGVPEAVRSRIFEPLFTTKEVGVGTGMGLSLSHRIMQGHAGRITLENNQAGGAVFALKLPAAEKPAAAGPARPAERPGSSGRRILIVDDEPDLAATLSEILEQDGHRVDCVAAGNTALERLTHSHYDVVLSDIRMPEMDGPSLYRSLRSRRPELIQGFAFITGDTLTPQLRDFIDSTERPCIEKPFTPRDIRQVIKLILRSQSR